MAFGGFGSGDSAPIRFDLGGGSKEKVSFGSDMVSFGGGQESAAPNESVSFSSSSGAAADTVQFSFADAGAAEAVEATPKATVKARAVTGQVQVHVGGITGGEKRELSEAQPR
jgi:hypothetical protein